MGWNRKRMKNQRTILLCMLENQSTIMKAVQAQLSTFEHTAKYGEDHIKQLQKRIDESEKPGFMSKRW